MAAGGVALLCGCASPSAPRSAVVAPAVPPVSQRAVVPEVKPAADGVSSMHRILQRWAPDADVRDLAQRVQHEEEGGRTHEEALMACASARALWPFAQYGSIRLLSERLASGVPVIVQLQDNPRAPRTRRYAVVTSYDEEARLVEGIDHAGRPFESSEGNFWRAWIPVRCWMLTACPPDVPKWRMQVLELMSRVQFYDGLGEAGMADREAAQAMLVDPNNTDLLVALANRERSLGRTAEADRLFRRVLNLDPHSARAANNLAFLLAEQGRNLDEAVDLSRRALLLEPTNAKVLDTLGYVLLQQGRYGDAVATLERARQRAAGLAPSVQNDIGMHLVWAHFKNGQRQRARLVLGDLLRINPGLLVPGELTDLVTPQDEAIN